MGVPCMPVRTKCVVIGTDLHDALGTLIAPPAPPVPLTPSAITIWLSASTTYYGMAGDKPVASVVICGEPAVNKGADTTQWRPHVVVMGAVPPNVVVGPLVDFGFFALVIFAGGTKPVWGPRSVQAGAKSIAVIAIPHSPYCPFNQLICTDPCDLPLGVALQMPSSVLVGMTLGDYALCIVNILADMALSFVLNILFGGLDFLGDFVGKISARLFSKIFKYLSRKLGKVIGKIVFLLFNKGVEIFTEGLKLLTLFLFKKFGKKVGKDLVRRIVGGLAKIPVEIFKKLVGEKKFGEFSPGGPLGFGDGPPPDAAPSATP